MATKHERLDERRAALPAAVFEAETRRIAAEEAAAAAAMREAAEAAEAKAIAEAKAAEAAAAAAAAAIAKLDQEDASNDDSAKAEAIRIERCVASVAPVRPLCASPPPACGPHTVTPFFTLSLAYDVPYLSGVGG